MGMHGQKMQWTFFHIWNNPKIVEELGLSDEQVGKLKECRFCHERKTSGIEVAA
jgi:hypothetical protein